MGGFIFEYYMEGHRTCRRDRGWWKILWYYLGSGSGREYDNKCLDACTAEIWILDPEELFVTSWKVTLEGGGLKRHCSR